jgi:hypothetical protein
MTRGRAAIYHSSDDEGNEDITINSPIKRGATQKRKKPTLTKNKSTPSTQAK